MEGSGLGYIFDIYKTSVFIVNLATAETGLRAISITAAIGVPYFNYFK